MKPENTKRLEPILCAAVFIVLLTAALILLLCIADTGSAALAALLLLFAANMVSVIVGIILALRQRLREIDSGEEEAAKQY